MSAANSSPPGRLTESFTVTGGFTVLQATVNDVTVASINGNVPVGVPQHMARLYGEYALPLPGLTLTGGISYNGSVYANAANTLSVPAVTTGDLGLRYATRIEGHDTTFRFNVQNITNENYGRFQALPWRWARLGPSRSRRR